MDEEMTSLLANKTWELCECPRGANIIPVRWIYKIKRGADGSIQRFKARLVAKGFKQLQYIEYDEVYAPTSKYAALRALLALCAEQDLDIHQLDIKTAFLYGELEEEIYMQQPPGYESGDKSTVCHLLKSLYGLKQAPRQWHLKLKATLEDIGFKPTAADAGLYVKHNKDSSVYLAVYVDDLLLAGRDVAALNEVKTHLRSLFELRDLGPVAHFLGMSITRDRDNRTLKIAQPLMITELVEKYGQTDAKAKHIPADPSNRLCAPQDEEDLLDTTKYPYSALIGSLLYLSLIHI